MHGAAVAIEGNRIVAVGPSEAVLADFGDAERIDGSGKALAPGFANCHLHLARVLGRGIFEDQNAPNRPPYSREGFISMPRMSPAERDVMVKLQLLEAIRSGTTLLVEVASAISEYAQLLIGTGLRLVLAEQVADRVRGARVGEPGRIEFDRSRQAEELARIDALHAAYHGAADGRVMVAIAAHAPDMVSPELFAALLRKQQSLSAYATVHLNQYWGEVAAIRETFGRLPTEHLDALGYLGEGLIAVHCRCMTPTEEEILGQRKVTVCFTPAVSARCGNSARIDSLAANGCRIVLGSDEFAGDMVEVLRLAVLLERARRKDSMAPAPKDAWHWAASGGYATFGIENAGRIEPGNKADLIVIDCRKPHLVPTTRIAAGFVHQGQASDVQSVMVDGRWLMRDGRVIALNEAEILDAAEQVGRAVWRRALTATGTAPPGINLEN
jgi:5-methylthioadenosine/S-adenosylhomocysteine deaminase